MLNELGEKIIQINTNNGWNVTKPSDWDATIDLNNYIFDEPRHIQRESGCQAIYEDFWICWAKGGPDNKSFCGRGDTSKEAIEAVKQNLLNPNSNVNAYKIPAVLALITSEVSEALEAFRNNDRKNFDEECADIIIRVLDMTAGLGIDIETEILNKLEKNKHRGIRHGGKRL